MMMHMHKRPRRFTDSFASKILGAALSLGSMEACDAKIDAADVRIDTDHEEKNQSVKKAADSIEHPVEQDEWDKKIDQIDCALFREHVPDNIQRLPDSELKAWLKKRMAEVTQEVADDMRKARYRTAKGEADYFRRLADPVLREKITGLIHEAAALTGVSEDVLLGIGCMESQWNEQEENLDTKVYGPMQMKLSTAASVAKRMNKKYALALRADTPEDLKDYRTSIFLAAGYMEILKEKYGEEVALAAYASGPEKFDAKVLALFPAIDFAKDAEKKRAEKSKEITIAAKEIELLKSSAKTPEQQVRLTAARMKWKESNAGYALYHGKELVARKKLPAECARYGVSPHTIYMKEITSPDGTRDLDDDDIHSIQYAIHNSEIVRLAKKHMQ